MEDNFKYLGIEYFEGIKTKKNIALIKMQRPNDNAMDSEMLLELRQAHEKLETDKEIKAIIVTSAIPGYFSNGLDLDELLDADLVKKRQIFATLFETCLSIYKTQKIHISLINGHAMAGGAVLSIMSDLRFFTKGAYRLCFSETRIGLGMPLIFLSILESILGAAHLKNAAWLSKAYKPEEAKNIGLVDAIYEEEQARLKTIQYVSALLKNFPPAFMQTRNLLRKKNIDLFLQNKEETLDWFSQFFNESFTEGLRSTKEKRRPKYN